VARPEIRVDQSHCNYHLSRVLKETDWEILFSDAGRVSRGGRGSQGIVLAIFEEAGLPIPDIVAVLGQSLLLIEIDSAIRKAERSLRTYRHQQKFIIDAINKRFGHALQVRDMYLGFCRTGILQKPGIPSVAVMSEIDLLTIFTEPEKPLNLWRPFNF
jgi:hypothetical protein